MLLLGGITSVCHMQLFVFLLGQEHVGDYGMFINSVHALFQRIALPQAVASEYDSDGGMPVWIKQCRGYELVKSKQVSPEEFFNVSEVVYQVGSKERTLHVMFLRYFEKRFERFVPYEHNPLFQIGKRDIYFRDIVGLVCLAKDSSLQSRKRLYIHSEQELMNYCQNADYQEIEHMMRCIETERTFQLGTY